MPEHAASQPELDPVLQVEYSKFSKITNKIILIVKSNYRSSQSLTNIAEIFNMSSKYIGRIFLKDTGIKFSEYLTAYRMIQARKLIENTQEKISVIANMVGYSQRIISTYTLRTITTSPPVPFGTSPPPYRLQRPCRTHPLRRPPLRKEEPRLAPKPHLPHPLCFNRPAVRWQRRLRVHPQDTSAPPEGTVSLVYYTIGERTKIWPLSTGNSTGSSWKDTDLPWNTTKSAGMITPPS